MSIFCLAISIKACDHCFIFCWASPWRGWSAGQVAINVKAWRKGSILPDFVARSAQYNRSLSGDKAEISSQLGAGGMVNNHKSAPVAVVPNPKKIISHKNGQPQNQAGSFNGMCFWTIGFSATGISNVFSNGVEVETSSLNSDGDKRVWSNCGVVIPSAFLIIVTAA